MQLVRSEYPTHTQESWKTTEPMLRALRALQSTSTRQGQPKKYISAQRDMMDLKGGLFCFCNQNDT